VILISGSGPGNWKNCFILGGQGVSRDASAFGSYGVWESCPARLVLPASFLEFFSEIPRNAGGKVDEYTKAGRTALLFPTARSRKGSQKA